MASSKRRCPNCNSNELVRFWIRSVLWLGLYKRKCLPCSQCSAQLTLNRNPIGSFWLTIGIIMLVFAVAMTMQHQPGRGLAVFAGVMGMGGSLAEAYFLRGLRLMDGTDHKAS